LPASISERNLDWDGIVSGANIDDTAYLLHEVGVKMKTDYGLPSSGDEENGGSAANANYIPGIMQQFGILGTSPYMLPKLFIESESKVLSCLNQADENDSYGPIVMFATSQRETGHTWICDGYMNAGFGPKDLYPIFIYTYYHCCWGHGGKDDGYYILNDDQWGGGYDDNLEKSKYTFDYTKDILCFYGFHKQD